ncbi:acetyl-CoA carboxylase (plasmid) [Rhizobium sp. RCAM05350]|nr:acetyl-CoA carboxylase [Rhizobium sp. RCAM05350]
MSGVDFSDPAVIASLAAALEAAGVDGIDIEQGTHKVRIVVERGGPGGVSQVDASQPAPATAEACFVAAPIAGFFCSGHPASVVPPFQLPREVVSGDTLAFVRIGPVLLPVRAPKTGVLTRFVAENGSLVGYGDPLFAIEPSP